MAVSREEIDAKLAAVEARTETRFVELKGAIEVLSVGVSSLSVQLGKTEAEAASNRNVIVGTVVATGLAVAATMIAILSYGAATFYNGTVVRDTVESAITAHHGDGSKPEAPARSGQ